MQKQSFKIIISLLIITTMFGIFKSMFAQTDNTELQKIINDDGFLVDVRTPSEYSEGNVKGSINIPLDKIPSELAKFKNKKHIVVFCRSGSRSSQAKIVLEINGFTNVINGGTWNDINNLLNN
jgi:phage shock protein E